MKCEIIREGQACNNTADVIVRTPWTTRLACFGCATPFERYEVSPIEFVCDWPMGGKECGEPATHYVEVKDFPMTYHRPLCRAHSSHCLIARHIDEAFDPKLVPHKPPVQPPPRVVLDGPKAGLWCWCGKTGKYRGGVEPMPLCDEHAPEAPKPEPPAVDRYALQTAMGNAREAFKDLVLTAIETLKEKVKKWR